MIKTKIEKLQKKLSELVRQDQELRKSPSTSIDEIKAFDKKTTEFLRTFINEVGWPTISKFGADTSHDAWVIVQHTLDIEFAAYCLELMEKVRHDVNKSNLAYLTDKVLLNQTKKQRYGTIVHTVKNGETWMTEPLPLENPDKVNELRASMTLEPLHEQLDRCHNLFMNLIKPKFEQQEAKAKADSKS